MAQKLYPQALANTLDQRAVHSVEEVTILRARFGTPQGSGIVQPLGLTLQLAARHGMVLAVYTDLTQMWELMERLDAKHPDELIGKKALATFNGRKLVGLSAL
jgi:hypothetical protein